MTTMPLERETDETTARPCRRLMELAQDNMDYHDNEGYLLLNMIGNELEIPFRQFCPTVHSLYLSGYCAFLALAINELTDLNFAVFTIAGSDDNSWSGHVAIQTGEDEYLDVRGFSTAAEINSFYGYGPDYEREEMELTITHSLAILPYAIFFPPVLGQPWSLFGELEELVTRDYAKQLVRDYLR